MARELFVYWRVERAAAAQASAAVRRMQQALVAAHAGLLTGLYRRDDASLDGANLQQLTLMEVYARPGLGIGDDIQAAIESAAVALAKWRRGARHVEVFERID